MLFDGAYWDGERLQSFVILLKMGLVAFQLFKSFSPDTQPESPIASQSSEIPLIQQPQPLFELSHLVCVQQKQRALKVLPRFQTFPSPFQRRVAVGRQIQTSSWSGLLESVLGERVVEFLNMEEWYLVTQVSSGSRKRVKAKMLLRENNWTVTLCLLGPCVMKDVGQIEEEYEHSEDLDRTSGYFEQQSQCDVAEQQGRLDRIISALSFKVRYFQGLMPICAALLQCFDQNVSYWLLRYLLHRCNYIQTNLNLYHCFLQHLEQQFCFLLPHTYLHLQNCGLELNYFVMKWVMGLFAEDMSKTMLLAVWDALCHSNLHFLVYLVIQIFRNFEQDILSSEADQINDLLKSQLKQRLSQLNCQEFILGAKQLYITRYLKTY